MLLIYDYDPHMIFLLDAGFLLGKRYSCMQIFIKGLKKVQKSDKIKIIMCKSICYRNYTVLFIK